MSYKDKSDKLSDIAKGSSRKVLRVRTKRDALKHMKCPYNRIERLVRRGELDRAKKVLKINLEYFGQEGLIYLLREYPCLIEESARDSEE